MESAPPRLINRPFRDLATWLSYFRTAEIPVLPATAEVLEEYAANEDAIDAHLLTQTVAADPLMTLKLLAHVPTLGPRATDVETVTGALVLMGMSPFFRRFVPASTTEQWLEHHPEAQEGLNAVIARAHRAATFALSFAVHRGDHDAHVIHEAALLHDFAEMLLWCHAPALALEIARRQAQDPSLRSAQAQRDVLGIELHDLQQALMRAWMLPAMLIRLDDDKHAESTQVRNVLLAIRVARHSARGWDNPAIPDDVRDISQLLLLGEVPTMKLLQEVDAS